MNGQLKSRHAQSGRVIPVILAILVLLLLGVAGFFAYRYHQTQKSLEAQSQIPLQEQGATTTNQPKDHKIVKKMPESGNPIFENVGEFVVNLSREHGSSAHVLQTNIQIQLYEDGDRSLVSSYQPKIKDHILRLLASKKYEELNTAEGKERLAKDVGVAIERAVGKQDIVHEVLFTSFIVQEQ